MCTGWKWEENRKRERETIVVQLPIICRCDHRLNYHCCSRIIECVDYKCDTGYVIEAANARINKIKHKAKRNRRRWCNHGEAWIYQGSDRRLRKASVSTKKTRRIAIHHIIPIKCCKVRPHPSSNLFARWYCFSCALCRDNEKMLVSFSMVCSKNFWQLSWLRPAGPGRALGI